MNKKFTRLITLVLVFLFSSSAFFVQGQATLTTDKPDYAPLSNAVFTGAGFAPNENVTLRVKNLTQPCNTTLADSSYASWTVTANASGSFVTNWTVCNCPGDSLRLKGVGQTSGLIAYVLFSDAGTNLLNPTPSSTTYGSIISISSKLTQQGSGSAPVFVGNGNPIPGKNVTFTLNKTALGASVVTDEQGVATLNATISLPANTYTGNEALTVVFAGDATPYAATSKKVNFTVTKATSLFSQVSGSGIYGLPANLTATVNLNVAGLPINFTLDGVAVGNSVTNSNGVANLTVAFASIPASVKNAGTYSGKLGVSINNTANYSAASGTGNITIAKAAQTITWSNPEDITYGTLLSATQLNATAAGVSGGSATGELTYSPAAGTLLNAGAAQDLTVEVAETANYEAASRTVKINVAKATQTITWSNPEDITYGALLSATQLNATAAGVSGGSAPGELTYTPAAGTLLNAGAAQNLTVEVAGTGNYEAASKTVKINVAKAAQTITWGNPADITYGTLLSANQLNATAAGLSGGSAAGEITYSPAAGTLLNAGAAQDLTVEVAATADYEAAKKTVKINVAKAAQTITWSNPEDITYGTLLSATQLDATAAGVSGGSATGELTYSPAAGTLLNAGAAQDLTVEVAETANYEAASKTVKINVAKVTQTITWSNPEDITYGALLSATQLNATAAGVIGGSAPGELTYTPAAGTLLNAGAAQDLTVEVAGTGNYEAASKTVKINVAKAAQTITWSNPADITYGTLLSANQLNATAAGLSGGSAAGELTYSPAAGTLLNAGAVQDLTVEVAATANYEAAKKTVKINVAKATTGITVANATGTSGGYTMLIATLKDLANNVLLNDKTITFEVNNTIAGTATTDVNGVASIIFNNCVSTGASIRASFATDANYSASTNTGVLKISTPAYVWTGSNITGAPQQLPASGGISITPTIAFAGLTLRNVSINWDDNSVTSLPGVFENFVTAASHTYLSAGVYAPKISGTDVCGNPVTIVFQYIVIYDPNGGFVTGGGWINSPAGAYIANPNLIGKATFGLVAKYKKGSTTLVDGETEFQFQAGNLKFNSTSYEAMSLVIGGSKASYKGIGTINGAGSYKFMLTAIDGDLSGGGGLDKLRMKISDMSGNMVYDNQLGALDNENPSTVLGGGSIVIHEVKKTAARIASTTAQIQSFSAFDVKVLNNPSRSNFSLKIESNDVNKAFTFKVMDINGRLIEVQQNLSSKLITLGNNYAPGMYFVEVTQGGQRKVVRLIKIK